MNFSDFRGISEVQEKFDITYAEEDFVKVHDAEPSEQFLQDFEWTRQNLNVFVSEASRCEAIIFPVLKENYKAYADNYELWIGTSIDYNATLLCGMEVREGQALALRTQEEKGNYLISTRSRLGKTVVGKPLIILVEAKRNDFDRGWGQCLAELVAAQKMNNDAAFPVYGIVTDGNLWQFGRLVDDTFTQNRTDFEWTNLPMLFGAVSAVFKAATESASTRT